MVTKELLHELFFYKDGELYWKVDRGSNKVKGKKAGGFHSGYESIQINKIRKGTHQWIFLMFNGYLPSQVDHIDGNTLNNRIENLRDANYSQNQHNAKIRKDNTSGIKGVSWHKTHKKWSVQLSVNGKSRHFGEYFDLEVAKFVIETMRHKYHGKFANHG